MSNWKDSFIEYFLKGIKRSEEKSLGVEVEHFILHKDSQKAVPYAGKNGVRDVLKLLMDFFPDAQIIKEDDLLGFTTADFNITLEPAAQFEISIAPTDDIQQIGEIYHGFRKNLDSILDRYGYMAFHAGGIPQDNVHSLTLIPKKRYYLMDSHFEKTGTGGIEMMRASASLQVSLDYFSEEDFRRKIQATYYYSPLLKLLCDNSKVFQGKPIGFNLLRTDIWRRVDPLRCGILPDIFAPDYGFEKYADFLGAMPPIFIYENGTPTPTYTKTVSQLYSERDLNENEIAHILSMAFPDVRLKHYIEIRVADSVPFSQMLGYVALIKGLIGMKTGLDYAQEQIKIRKLSVESIAKAEDDLMRNGWEGHVYGRPAKSFVRLMLDMAREGLSDADKKYLDVFA